MTLTEILSESLFLEFDKDGEYRTLEEEEFKTLVEAKRVVPTDYKRHWQEWPLDEKHYSKKTGNRLYGRWVYDHREAAGAKYNDNKIIHHKNEDKLDNSKSNLQVTDRAGHCRIDPNARKFFKCSVPGCKEPHYSHHLCLKHFMQQYRKGKFGNYDKSKNYSKKER